MLFLFLATLLIQLEHAATHETRMRGLMGRLELEEGSGMLFHFEEEDSHPVWAMNCYIPLSLAFMNKEGVIVELADLEAYPELYPPSDANNSFEKRSFFLSRAVYPRNSSRYLLEVPKGWFKRQGIEVGDQMSWERERGFFSKQKPL